MLGKDGKPNVHDSSMLPCMIYNLNLNCLVDTGATISLLQPEKYYAIIEEKRPPLEPYLPKIRMGDDASITAIGCAIFPPTINGRLTPQKMAVANTVVAGVLGYDFLYDNGADINIREGSVSINGTAVRCELESKRPSVFRINTMSCETVTIPPNSKIIIRGKIHGMQRQRAESLQAFIEPAGECLAEKNVLVAKSLVEIRGGSVPLRLANLSNGPQTIYNNTFAARCEPVETVEEEETSTPSATYCRTDTTVNGQGEIPVHLRDLY